MRKLVSIVLSAALLVCYGVASASVVGDLLKVGIDAQSNNITITNPKNLKVGNGTPNTTLNGEDMYVEGTLEVDGAARFDGAVSFNSAVAFSNFSPGPQSDSFLYVSSVEITNTQLKGLATSPKVLVAAPGAGKFIELISAVLILNYGSEALTAGAGDDLVIEYGTSGQDATASIETTGFVTATADTMAVIPAATIATAPAANIVNKALQLSNVSSNFGGNASNDTTMTVKVTYRVHAAGL